MILKGKALMGAGIAAGAVILTLLVGLGLVSKSLLSAREALGESRSALETARGDLVNCAATNTRTMQELRDTRDRLADAVRDRALDRMAAERARAEREQERNRREARARATQAELDALYAGDCEAWARLPVCDQVADKLRDLRAGGTE